MRLVGFVVICVAFNCTSLFGQTTLGPAPGAPGNDAQWPTAAKVGFGTSNTLQSKVWFTLASGAMTEAYYPRLDLPDTQCLQLIVCRTSSACEDEIDGTNHRVRILNPRALSFQQINTSRNNRFTITKTYATDPHRPTILIQVKVDGIGNADDVYVYYDPSLNNSGLHDTGWIKDGALLASDSDVTSVLISSTGFEEATVGYRGTSDGWVQLRQNRRLAPLYDRAEIGNIVQVARIRSPRAFTLALGFGANGDEALFNARSSLARGFAKVLHDYELGWSHYLKSLRSVEPRYQRQFNMAAMVLKGLEDKTHHGAMIASPSIPWGGGPNANEATISGYHAVWARDLYHLATAFLAMGDRAAANRALDYLFKVQQKPDGSFPQNTWLDGRAIGNGLQMDQVALPLVLAYQLARKDKKTWIRHIKPAADFIVRNGPITGQDRWEEESGYSPATIAAEIAGLVCAAELGKFHGERSAVASYLRTADQWAEHVVAWTATSSGPYGGKNYYLRITEHGNPDEAAKLEINSGGGTYDQREIVDASFLELVRLGIKEPGDLLILESIDVVDTLIKMETPAGPAWYRYNHDGYGERLDGQAYDGRSGKGRLWTLLTGERAEFELARGNIREARRLLDALNGFGNEGLMIPEQVWDVNASSGGFGTGSATPLAWSMAQFIRLTINLKLGRNIETPQVVRDRYRSMN